jgi:putative photosynthetic complex assembly protein
VTDATTNPSPRMPMPLVLAIALVCGTLAVAAGARLSNVGTNRLDYSRPATTRDLLFEDVSDGSIAIRDANTREQIGEIVPGNDGFVRAVMRLLARERLLVGGNKATPFTLTRWENGRLTIGDPATGKKTELVGFGATNEKAFAKFLPQRSEEQ